MVGPSERRAFCSLFIASLSWPASCLSLLPCHMLPSIRLSGHTSYFLWFGVYFWVLGHKGSAQGLLLMPSGDHVGCQGLNSGQLRARQAPCLLCYLSPWPHATTFIAPGISPHESPLPVPSLGLNYPTAVRTSFALLPLPCKDKAGALLLPI